MDDLDDSLQRVKVGRISGVKRQIICCRRGSNQQVRQPCAARLSGCSRRRKYPTVRAGGLPIKWQGVPRCTRPLQPVLASSAFALIFRSVWTRGQFSERYGGNCGFIGQHCGIDHVVVDHHRRVEEPSRRFSHRCPDLPRHRDPHETGRHRSEVRGLPRRQGLIGARTGAAEWAAILRRVCRCGLPRGFDRPPLHEARPRIDCEAPVA